MARRPRPARLAVRLAPVAASAALVAVASGCGPLGAIRSFIQGSDTGSVVDAHVVYRLRPGCPTLLARTIQHGYSVMTPLETPPDVDTPAGAAGPLGQPGFDLTGLFEGPVREGESVFQYYPPAETETWRDERAEVLVNVEAVNLDLSTASARLDAICGPLPPGEGAPSETVPRIPGT